MARRRSDSPANDALVGWLISYDMDANGVAFELRSGRHFISSEGEILNKTIAIDDATISSPHLALNASREQKVMIQDIFSDFGTFLQRATAEDEVRVAGPTIINHGDWIRIGEKVRLQICLIDGAGK